jgi:hypothetical protein
MGDGSASAGGREPECRERHGVERQLGVQVGQVRFEERHKVGRIDRV